MLFFDIFFKWELKFYRFYLYTFFNTILQSPSKLISTCSMSTIETLEKSVKYIQS